MNSVFAHLLEAAQRAPSAHNTQPWLLDWQNDELRVSVLPERMLAVADPENADLLHALGALLENLMLTLTQLGFEGDYHLRKDFASKEPFLSLRWKKNEDIKGDSRLYQMIPIRKTSRLKYAIETIPVGVFEDMQVATSPPCQLHVLTDSAAISEIRELATQSSVHFLANRNYVEELHRWIRFSREDRRWYRDGLNAESMGWNRIEAAVIGQIMKPVIVQGLARLGLAKLIFGNIEQQAPFAPALCLLTTRNKSLSGRIEAGRSLQRTWLTAAFHGLVTHPLSAAVDCPRSRARVLELFESDAGESPVNLFRIGKSAKVARSPRLPADELVARIGGNHFGIEGPALMATKASSR